MLPEIGNYVALHESGELKAIATKLKELLSCCVLCPRTCGINRYEQTGFCSQKSSARFSNAVVHKGEEPPLIQGTGAGAVFFSGCTMKCVYCQNFGFSQLNAGHDVSDEELADSFLTLQHAGVSNLDLVSPTPHLPSIVNALDIGASRGLQIPVVYNTSSYERVEILRLLQGIVDVYLADIRYTDDSMSMLYSLTSNYWIITQKALREMIRQVGASHLIIRLLILPENIGGTKEALAFVAEELSMNVHISLMSQYFPVYKALTLPRVNRKITRQEYEEAQHILEDYGFEKGWTQDFT